MVAPNHNGKQYLEPFFPAILRDDLHRSNDGILERTMHLKWLEPSEEDPLVYIVNDEDNKDPPHREDDDDQPTRIEGGRSIFGRRATRYVVAITKNKFPCMFFSNP